MDILFQAGKPVNIDGNEVKFYWEPTPKELNLTRLEMMHQDCPEAYAVTRAKHANGGIIVYGKFRGRWECNPSARFLIRHLLHQLLEAEFQYSY